jgi:hypothetical protein
MEDRVELVILFCDTRALMKLLVCDVQSDRMRQISSPAEVIGVCRISWAEAMAYLDRLLNHAAQRPQPDGRSCSARVCVALLGVALARSSWPAPTAVVGRLRRIAAWLDDWCVVVAPGRWGQPRRPGVSGVPDRGAQVCL